MSIVLRDLVKRYGADTVVDRVGVEIGGGELFVLLGPSGSGKSTILRMIAGLLSVDDGRILLDGRDVTELPPQQRNVGFVFQNYSLFPHLSVAENVEFGLTVRRVPRHRRATRRDELLALVGLAGFGGRDVRSLSGGQQQRVALARALAFSPSVLLLDEPFGALDVKIRAQLRRALRTLQRALGITTVLVTHDQEEAFELADRIGVIDGGRLLEVGAPGELYRRPRHELVASFLGEANLLGVGREGEHARLGPLRLPLPISLRDSDPGIAWAVLLRPEDLVLAEGDADPRAPVLGHAFVEEVLDLGAWRRVRLRLEPLPGAWPLGGEFGDSGILLRASTNGAGQLRAGQRVRVGVRHHHLLPRLTRRVLLWDGGGGAPEGLLAFARSVVAALVGRMTLVSVVSDDSEGQRRLPRLREALGSGPGVDVQIRYGSPPEEVLREAARESYDLLMLPRIAAADPQDGAVAEIVRRSRVPVMVVPGARPSLRRVLLCTAAGEPGKLDVVFGGQLARSAGAEATLLHVDDPQMFRQASARDAARSPAARPPSWIRHHLEQGVRTLESLGVAVEAKVRRGPVLDEILAEAAAGDDDLIVVGGHMAGTWLDVPDRDLASDLIALADRPVLVVKAAFR